MSIHYAFECLVQMEYFTEEKEDDDDDKCCLTGVAAVPEVSDPARVCAHEMPSVMCTITAHQ